MMANPGQIIAFSSFALFLIVGRIQAAPDSTILAGGATTVFDLTGNAFGLPAQNLAENHRSAFFLGNSFFNKNWVEAPASVTDRDGLGPLFNARSCSSCHLHDGRGRPPLPGDLAVSMLVRISIPGGSGDRAPRPDPVYGDQLQPLALPGLAGEAEIRVIEDPVPGAYGDGEPFTLLHPRTILSKPGYGPWSRSLLTSSRVAPAMVGLGLLEMIPESKILAPADPDDRNGDGISGRPNQVPDRALGKSVLGRFGWKAEQPSVRQQAAGAFLGDMGLTSTLLPGENHSSQQRACAHKPSGGTPEVSDAILRNVSTYVRLLGVPARRPGDRATIALGQSLFTRVGCPQCHTATWQTGDSPDLPELGHQTIHPFTDLLLHDMGDGLADGRPAFDASAKEWRTPPLWGIGLLETVSHHQRLLHDGRARGVAEAILWHGGEAKPAREAFRTMTRQERAAVVAFVQTL